MTPEEYVKQAMRTECPQAKTLQRLNGVANPQEVKSSLQFNSHKMFVPVRVIHAVLGMGSEVGELASLLMKWVYYGARDGKPVDLEKFKDELGDVFWFAAQLCDAVGVTFTEVMEANIRKLRTRFPERYSDEAIADKDREAEMKAVTEATTPAVEERTRPCPACNGQGCWYFEDTGQWVSCARCYQSGKVKEV